MKWEVKWRPWAVSESLESSIFESSHRMGSTGLDLRDMKISYIIRAKINPEIYNLISGKSYKIIQLKETLHLLRLRLSVLSVLKGFPFIPFKSLDLPFHFSVVSCYLEDICFLVASVFVFPAIFKVSFGQAWGRNPHSVCQHHLLDSSIHTNSLLHLGFPLPKPEWTNCDPQWAVIAFECPL